MKRKEVRRLWLLSSIPSAVGVVLLALDWSMDSADLTLESGSETELCEMILYSCILCHSSWWLSLWQWGSQTPVIFLRLSWPYLVEEAAWRWIGTVLLWSWPPFIIWAEVFLCLQARVCTFELKNERLAYLPTCNGLHTAVAKLDVCKHHSVAESKYLLSSQGKMISMQVNQRHLFCLPALMYRHGEEMKLSVIYPVLLPQPKPTCDFTRPVLHGFLRGSPRSGRGRTFYSGGFVHRFPLNVLSDLWSAPGTGWDGMWWVSHFSFRVTGSNPFFTWCFLRTAPTCCCFLAFWDGFLCFRSASYSLFLASDDFEILLLPPRS